MIVYGASGHAKVIHSVIKDEVSFFVDDDKTKSEFLDKPVFAYSPDRAPEDTCVVAIGDNAIRKKIVGQIRHKFNNIIATSALIDERVQIGKGNQILHRSVIQAGTVIGNHTIVNTNASIDHDCILGDFVHIAPNSTLCGNVSIGEGSFIGAGAIIIPGVRVGSWCTIGAGSVVIKDVKDNSTIVGNPGRELKSR